MRLNFSLTFSKTGQLLRISLPCQKRVTLKSCINTYFCGNSPAPLLFSRFKIMGDFLVFHFYLLITYRNFTSWDLFHQKDKYFQKLSHLKVVCSGKNDKNQVSKSLFKFTKELHLVFVPCCRKHWRKLYLYTYDKFQNSLQWKNCYKLKNVLKSP